MKNLRSTSMQRPMVWIALFSLGALLLCLYGADLKITLAVLLGAAVLSAVFVRKSLLPLVIVLVISALAAARFTYIENRAAVLREKYDGFETLIIGEIYSEPTYTSYLGEVVLKTDLGLINLTCYRSDQDIGKIGDIVTVNAKLAAPSRPDNDYGFDRRSYLMSRGIYLTAESSEAPRFFKSGRRGIRYGASKVRKYAVSMGEKHLHGSALELYRAIIFGDRSALTPELKNDLSVAGLSHIAAVSGMHLSVIAVIIMFLLSLLFGKRRLPRLLIIPAMIFFALMTGGQSSVVRACIMNIIFQLAMILYRDSDGLSSLSAAFTAMILYNPIFICSTGFQLSVAATLGILLFSDLLMRPVCLLTEKELFTKNAVLRLTGKITHGLLAIVAVSLSAQLATIPIIVYNFRCISTYALLSNLLVVPLLTPIMAAGLALAVFGAVPALGAFIALICGPLLSYVAFVAHKVAALPKATVSVSASLPVILGYTALLLGVYAFLKKRKVIGAVLCAAFVAAAALSGVQLYRQNNVSELCFLNTGRGDCALFNLSGGTRVLIDGGRRGSVISDYLDARGMFSLDCAVVTSNRLEHLSGLIDLVDGGYIKVLWLPAELEMNDRLETLLLSAEERNVPVRRLSSGGSLYLGGLSLRLIDCDGTSSQLAAEYGGKRILLCGDSIMKWEDCDIVKMPNHGGGSYNYYAQLSRHHPGCAVVTASGDRSSGSMEVIRDMDIPYYIPALCGTVTFDLSGEEISVTTTDEKYKKAR